MGCSVECWDSIAQLMGVSVAYETGIEHAVRALRAGNPDVAERMLVLYLLVAAERAPGVAVVGGVPWGPAAVLARLTGPMMSTGQL